MNNLIDSHAHILDEAYKDDYQGVIERAKQAGLKQINIICCEFDQALKAVKLKQQNQMFQVSVGIFPNDKDKLTASGLKELTTIVSKNNIDMIGEIGLDYYWEKDYKELQQEYFIKQINLANQYNLPVVIHSRDAANDTLKILKEHPVNRKGIIHCYSQSLEMAREYIKLGYLLGIGGVVTFKNAKTLKKVVTEIDLKNLIVETDAPYLTPTPFRGKQNEPAYIQYTYQEIANLKGISVEELISSCQKNYARLLGHYEDL